jgi:BON domain
MNTSAGERGPIWRLASGQFLGIKDELSAVPPQALHLSSARDFLRLDIRAGALAAAPHFPARAWPLIDREQAGQVYRAYHVVPYFLPFSLNPAAQTPVQSDAEIVASLDAVGHQADLNVTKQIRENIERADNLSLDARNIAINTAQGRVCLTGTVADRAEKRRLGRIAARYAPPGWVDNRLQIKPVATSASD